jgi:hypothetical protein
MGGKAIHPYELLRTHRSDAARLQVLQHKHCDQHWNHSHMRSLFVQDIQPARFIRPLYPVLNNSTAAMNLNAFGTCRSTQPETLVRLVAHVCTNLEVQFNPVPISSNHLHKGKAQRLSVIWMNATLISDSPTSADLEVSKCKDFDTPSYHPRQIQFSHHPSKERDTRSPAICQSFPKAKQSQTHVRVQEKHKTHMV